jgi:hypothetical protein
MWVWADPSGIGDPSAPYVFQTRFYLEVDLSRHWVEIKGKWGADNFGQLTIDGAALPPGSGSGEISLPSGDVATNYTQPHDFSISQAHAISQSQLQLKVGWHTLEVSVSNEGPAGVQNPAGLNMSALNMVIHSVAQCPTPVLHPLGH